VLVTMQGAVQQRHHAKMEAGFEMLTMDFRSLDEYHSTLWTGNLEDKRIIFQSHLGGHRTRPVHLNDALVVNRGRNVLFSCCDPSKPDVTLYRLKTEALNGNKREEIAEEEPCNPVEWVEYCSLSGTENLLQLQLSETENDLLGTSALGFCIWNIEGLLEDNRDTKVKRSRTDLKLPSGVRNITVKLLQSNSIILSKGNEYAVAGVRKNLYVWNMSNSHLVKTLDAHFGRILAVVPYTIGPWNSVITSSIDRSVKVWNLNNVFEQVHVIDRHELQIDSISLCQAIGVAVTVTRGSVGVWDILTGKLLDKLAYNTLGAIVTHAKITTDGKYIIAAESGSVLGWEWPTRKVLFRDEQPAVKQMTLMENDTKFFTVSRLGANAEGRVVLVVRECPSGVALYQVEAPNRSFRPVVVTNDQLLLVMFGHEKKRDCLFVFQAQTGALVHKFPPRYQGMKECSALVPVPGKMTQIALMEQEKGVVFDVRTKKYVRTIRRWSGQVTRDGRLGLYAPSRGGLELTEFRTSSTVSTLITRTAEGVFTNVTSFNATDQYVLYYHSGHKTLRVFRVRDGQYLANYRLSAELTAIQTTTDGRCVVIGTLDGCLTVLAISDPLSEASHPFLTSLPSRRFQARKPCSSAFDNVDVHQDSGQSSPASTHMSFKTAAVVATAWAQTHSACNSPRQSTDVTSKTCVIS